MFLLPLIFTLASFAHQAPDTTVRGTAELNKTLLLQLVNDVRKKGCHCGQQYMAPAPPLVWNERLEQVARAHSRDMADKKFFSHTGSGGAGSGERIRAAGYNWTVYGENIAEGFPTERQVVEGWLKSPGHCSNIMNPNFTEMGVARVGQYWTQDFGSRPPQ